MTDVSSRVFRDKRNQKQFDQLSLVKSHCNTIFRPRFFWLILIASKARAGNDEVHGIAGSNSGTDDFIEKGKFVPKEEIEGFQYDTLKRLSLGYHNDVPSTKTKGRNFK